jgi:hypothetical protein
MARAFDPGYGAEPYRTLAAEAPGSSVYPGKDFRIEWGHRLSSWPARRQREGAARRPGPCTTRNDPAPDSRKRTEAWPVRGAPHAEELDVLRA